MSNVYVVSLCTKVNTYYRKDGSTYGIRDIHVFGIFLDYHDAMSALEGRANPTEDGYYEHAVIETTRLGISEHHKSDKVWYTLGGKMSTRGNPPNEFKNSKRVYTKGL